MRIRREIRVQSPKRPVSYRLAWTLAQDLAGALRNAGVVTGRRGTALVFAGSFRRKADPVGDLDVLLVDRTDPEWQALTRVPALVLEQFGPKKAHGRFRRGRHAIAVDFRRVETRSLGAALEYFTGPKGHNVGMRMK
ncbi:MAG: hypothetical protein Q8Q14_07355, partial [Gemmatimonadales bacterium]|nr:hypothetical protein [Gemmatimonadales bacterium]